MSDVADEDTNKLVQDTASFNNGSPATNSKSNEDGAEKLIRKLQSRNLHCSSNPSANMSHVGWDKLCKTKI